MTSDRFRLLTTRAALALCLSVGVIACGDDDDDTDAAVEDTGGDSGGTDEQAAGGDECQAIAAFDEAVGASDTDVPDDELKALGEELGGIWADVAAGAPEEVSAEAAEITAALDDLAVGDPAKFMDESIEETYLTVQGAVIEGCDFETLSVTAVNYAFEGLPETTSAGTVALELQNKSDDELHEMVLFKRPEGETRSAEEILNDPESQETGPPPSGFVFADTGQTGTGLANLEPGEYIVACFIPVGSTAEEGGSEDAPPHFTQGMFAEFTVE